MEQFGDFQQFFLARHDTTTAEPNCSFLRLVCVPVTRWATRRSEPLRFHLRNGDRSVAPSTRQVPGTSLAETELVKASNFGNVGVRCNDLRLRVTKKGVGVGRINGERRCGNVPQNWQPSPPETCPKLSFENLPVVVIDEFNALRQKSNAKNYGAHDSGEWRRPNDVDEQAIACLVGFVGGIVQERIIEYE